MPPGGQNDLQAGFSTGFEIHGSDVAVGNHHGGRGFDRLHVRRDGRSTRSARGNDFPLPEFLLGDRHHTGGELPEAGLEVPARECAAEQLRDEAIARARDVDVDIDLRDPGPARPPRQ